MRARKLKYPKKYLIHTISIRRIVSIPSQSTPNPTYTEHANFQRRSFSHPPSPRTDLPASPLAAIANTAHTSSHPSVYSPASYSSLYVCWRLDQCTCARTMPCAILPARWVPTTWDVDFTNVVALVHPLSGYKCVGVPTRGKDRTRPSWHILPRRPTAAHPHWATRMDLGSG